MATSLAERVPCRASAARIASGASSHSAVLPSTSVRRKVTVPLGSSAMPTTPVLNGATIRQRASPLLALPARA